MYKLHLQSGRAIESASLIHALGSLDAECGTQTHASRMAHLGSIERLEARGMTYSNQDFDVLSSALNFLDAVQPEHGLREAATEQRHTFTTGDHYEAIRNGKTVAMADTPEGARLLGLPHGATEVRRVTKHGQTVGRACWRAKAQSA